MKRTDPGDDDIENELDQISSDLKGRLNEERRRVMALAKNNSCLAEAMRSDESILDFLYSEQPEKIGWALCALGVVHPRAVTARSIIAACEHVAFNGRDFSCRGQAMSCLVLEIMRQRDPIAKRSIGKRLADLVSDETAEKSLRRAAYAALCLFSFSESRVRIDHWPDLPYFPNDVNWNYVREHQKAGWSYMLRDYWSVLLNKVWKAIGIPGCR